MDLDFILTILQEHEERQQREAEQHPEVVQRAWYLPDEKSNQLIRQLSDEEELLNFDTPQGLLVSIFLFFTLVTAHY